MPTIVTEKKFPEVTNYPEIEKDYSYTLKNMKGLKFDLWLSSHANQFGLHNKHKPGDPCNPAALLINLDMKIAGPFTTAVRQKRRAFNSMGIWIGSFVKRVQPKSKRGRFKSNRNFRQSYRTT